ncbi:hypothetical protein HMSSN036_08430 [Paenibacillus macerans]|nr:hypothetical protein HMSSN036_08430 [Paenibacillus macerans]
MQGLKQLGSALRYLLVAAASLLMAFPFYWMVTSALKSNDEIWQFPPTLWPQSPKWGQFAEAWVAAPFERYMVNSIFVAISIVVLQIINSGMMAYALTHMKFRLKGFLPQWCWSDIWCRVRRFTCPAIFCWASWGCWIPTPG